jgi:hypothetical protein
MSAATLAQALVVWLPAATLLGVLWWLDRDPVPAAPRSDGAAPPGGQRTTSKPAGTSQAPSDSRPGRAA